MCLFVFCFFLCSFVTFVMMCYWLKIILKEKYVISVKLSFVCIKLELFNVYEHNGWNPFTNPISWLFELTECFFDVINFSSLAQCDMLVLCHQAKSNSRYVAR